VGYETDSILNICSLLSLHRLELLRLCVLPFYGVSKAIYCSSWVKAEKRKSALFSSSTGVLLTRILLLISLAHLTVH
jgi:hypothetical protein